VNVTVESRGVPRVDMVIGKRGTQFDFKTWTIEVPERYFTDSISHTEFLDMYATAMHEAEHAVDWFNMARLKAPDHPNAASLANALDFRGPLAVGAARRAFANPMAANDPLRARALAIYESVYGGRSIERGAIYTELDAAKTEHQAADATVLAKMRARS